jgi:DNA-binding MarR family transcriptional regulator
LSEWARRFALSEAEFHLLWRLRDASHDGLDQTTIAEELAFSAAQVSATVERLRARELIFQQPAPGDRRRHLWRLSAGGGELIAQMLNAATHWRCAILSGSECAATARAREAAA